MAVTYFPFNSIVVDGVPDRPANAENLAAYLAGFFSNGVLMQTDTALKVEASSGMNVQIHAGMGNINGKTILADAAEIITLDTASASLARIDRVVFRLDEVKRLMEFDVLKGTPASSPVAPALTQRADVYEMCLAEIRVPAGATSIAASYITDTRLNQTICGASQIPEHPHRYLLWENASPTSEFPEQSISVDLSQYDFIAVLVRDQIGSALTREFVTKNITGDAIHIAMSWTGGSSVKLSNRVRRTTITSQSVITFSPGVYATAEAGQANNNSSCIPLAIYGIKGGQ